jgi:uroporphyrinogen decarboxylase
MERATEALSAWAVAQIQRGCDAIKNSSPYVGGGFLSREHYQEFVVPYEKKLAQAVRDAGGFVYTHTCGAIGDRLDLIVESGVNGIECLDPPPLGNTDLAEAKEKFGKQIFIKGNVDSVNVLLRGTPDKVREDVRQRLAIGSAGGGFILSTACSIAPAVKPEHIKIMVEETREFSEQRM